MRPWVTLSRETALDQSPWLVVENHTVRLPNGRVLEPWPWVIAPDYVGVAPMTDEGSFLCFRQITYAVDGTSLAAIGGYLGPDESACAARELREETGYEATSWTHLGTYAVDANRGVGRGHFFLARGARRAGPATEVDLEDQEFLLMSAQQIEAALLAGEFKVSYVVGHDVRARLARRPSR